MDDRPIKQVHIPGPTLSSLLHRISTSSGDIDGLLFGSVTFNSPVNLSDDSSSDNSPSLIATVTSFFSSSSTSTFYTPSGQINLQFLRKVVPPTGTLIGWFSGRRKTAFRPSMRETCVTESLSSNIDLSFQVLNSPNANSITLSPCLFLLLTTPFRKEDQVFIHTHDYRVYQFRLSTDCFEPKTLKIINIGPNVGHYVDYETNSPFPQMPCEIRDPNLMSEDVNIEADEMSLTSKNQSQIQLDMCADGFQLKKLENLTGPEASGYTAEVEDLYSKMIRKLNGLARLVEKSSVKVLEQETRVMKLRYKVAGLE
ncbi:uncharacterized protein LOC141724632 [Apium graveolens]|uniref:uncharacterized protein LOC141724632 n=1 Tax=Apium graveolens TaxID=4045 RepID=UPI003D79E0B9